MKFAYRVLLVSVGVSFLGAGCLKKSADVSAQKTTPAPVAQQSPTPPVVTFPTSEIPDASINAELDRVLKAFHDVKSFRMKFTAPIDQGTMQATLEFAKPNRFQGTMQISSQPATEIIVVDDVLFMRTKGAPWLNLSNTDTSKAIGTSLKGFLNGDSSLAKVGVDPSAIVKKERDDARSCDRYTATVRGSDGNPTSLVICASNSLPKYVDVSTDKGLQTFEYYDYNALFLIEKPL